MTNPDTAVGNRGNARKLTAGTSLEQLVLEELDKISYDSRMSVAALLRVGAHRLLEELGRMPDDVEIASIDGVKDALGIE